MRGLKIKTEVRQIFALLLISLLTFGGCATHPEYIVISEDGQPLVNIVVGEDVSKEVLFAAEELQTYIKKISDADLKIIHDKEDISGKNIYVGNSGSLKSFKITAENLGREGFTIRTHKGNLVLLGYDDVGTQFAVYTFLEDYLGVRWLWPGELGEIVPRKKSIRIGEINESQQPDFKWRDRGPGGALWGATSGPTEMHARSRLLGITEKHQEEVMLWEKRNKWGGMKVSGGHSISDAFPPEKYATSHPEYFALVNGKRDVPGPDYDHKHGSHICTTNPDVIEIASEWAVNFFDKHPEYDAVNMSMNDGGGYCECENCRALDSGIAIKGPNVFNPENKERTGEIITDRIFTYINQIAERVQQKHPEKYVVCFAYGSYKMPPKNIDLEPMVIPQYTLWSAYMHANPEFKAHHIETIKAWKEEANRVAIYEYYINGDWPGLPRIPVSSFATSIKDLYNMGVDLFQTQSGDEFAINGINYYIAGKLLWDTSLDEQNLLNDFYDKGFGKAGKYVQSYHKRFEEAWKSATIEGKDVMAGNIETTRILELYTPKLLEACSQDLELAEEMAEDEIIKKRIDFLKKGLQYTQLTVKATKKTKELLSNGVSLELNDNNNLDTNQARLINEALSAWEEREAFVEEVKNDYVLAYFWIKYNNNFRSLNPYQKLKALSETIEASS